MNVMNIIEPNKGNNLVLHRSKFQMQLGRQLGHTEMIIRRNTARWTFPVTSIKLVGYS